MAASSDAVGAGVAAPIDARGIALGFDLPARYEARKSVGKGSFGVLISAFDREDNELIAVKKVQCGGALGWDRQERKVLLRELRLLQHFEHENIMRLRDLLIPASSAPRSDGSFSEVYLVQDLMSTDLHYIIQSAARGKQRITDDHCQYFTYQLLRGLKAIHSAKVLHRDLKPANLLINKDCELRIADFGLARGVDTDPAHGPALTEYVVTRWYRAPELLTGNESYGPAIDLWSVGCILAEMLSALEPGNVGDKAALFPGNDVLSALKLIVATVGVPSDLSFIRNTKAIAYVQALARGAGTPTALGTRYPKAPAAAIDLLQQLIDFDPSARLTADEALAHPFLASLHGLNSEPAAAAFDFSFESASDTELRDLLKGEVRRFHPDVPTTPSPPSHGSPAPSTPGSASSAAGTGTSTARADEPGPSQRRCGNKRGRSDFAGSSSPSS